MAYVVIMIHSTFIQIYQKDISSDKNCTVNYGTAQENLNASIEEKQTKS